MHPRGARTVLVSYGSLTTKSESARWSMLEALEAQLRGLLDHRGQTATIDLGRDRCYLRCDETAVESVARTAATTFGVAAARPAVRVEPIRDAITSTLESFAATQYDAQRFAVRAHRAGDEHPFTSEDVERFGGAAVFEGAPEDTTPTVDLDDPELTIRVEVRPEDAYVSCSRYDGPGGLPYGTQAPVVALVSGGIDSPVAAYELLRRGSPVVPVYLALGDYGGPDHAARAAQTVRRLAAHAPHDDWGYYRVPAGEDVALLADELDAGRMLAFRRYAFRVAAAIADREDAAGIATGEAIGQKSSQTTANLSVTARGTDYPVYRPLLTMDKHEITERARAIGTFDDSTIPAGCQRFAPASPATDVSIEWLRGVEPAGLFEHAEQAAANATYHSVKPADDLSEDRR